MPVSRFIIGFATTRHGKLRNITAQSKYVMKLEMKLRLKH